MKRIFCVVLSLMCFAAVPAFAEIQVDPNTKVDGLSWKDKQDRWQKGDANKGNPQAQLDYAKSIAQTNPQLAVEYAEKAGAQNLAEAWYWLGYTGLGKESSMTYFERAAQLGYPNAFTPLFDQTLFRAGPNANPAKAKQYADLARAKNIAVPDAQNVFTTIDICAAAGKPVVPTGDRISAQQKQAFKDANCVAVKSQAQQTNAGWSNYRYCVLSKEKVDGNALAEIYANGWGVKRNPQLAIAILCHSSTVPGELTGAVAKLYQTRSQASLSENFSICSHATSGSGLAACAQSDQGDQINVDQSFEQISKNFTPQQKAIFGELQLKAKDYFNEAAAFERSSSKSMSGSEAITAASRMTDDFIRHLEEFEMGSFPSPANPLYAEQEMHAAYQQLIQRYRQKNVDPLRVEGLKSAQGKFVAYRDAMAKFGAARYPKTSTVFWKSWATQQRAEILRNAASDY